ncbi:MAG: GreA/GreB family elongation factor [Candidatus Omnitrophica bacterium]|jgi:regulator of nucleoside diphosphate kinase|nr:GreA/GreB family elongation factor [Candidatus Omnitrophota bacterium]MDD3987957.1 GreA/GreB family elongation factor [Candidatus Omnitrophota bacterium]MDD4982313.1 GreA/GreB family elongation factor [Candidatus Omnitrophota bacterium]
MDNKQIYITETDFKRLKETVKNMMLKRDADRRSLEELERSYGSRDELGLIQDARRVKNSKNGTEWKRIEELEIELNRAIIVNDDNIPQGIVTMNTKVCLQDMETKKDEVYQLVYPEDADIEQNKISVLAPIGTAILGYKVGDIIEWNVPAGLRKLRVKKVLYRVESAKGYHF